MVEVVEFLKFGLTQGHTLSACRTITCSSISKKVYSANQHTIDLYQSNKKLHLEVLIAKVITSEAAKNLSMQLREGGRMNGFIITINNTLFYSGWYRSTIIKLFSFEYLPPQIHLHLRPTISGFTVTLPIPGNYIERSREYNHTSKQPSCPLMTSEISRVCERKISKTKKNKKKQREDNRERWKSVGRQALPSLF